MEHRALKVGLAQIAPVWLHRGTTLTKVIDWIDKAATEGCELVVFVSGLMTRDDIGDDLPAVHVLREAADDVMADGGFCVAMPSGEWLLEPETGAESLRIAELDHRIVLEERHSLDVAGHYSRPDVIRLIVNRERQTTAEFDD